jgi:DNA (cytosine-5)-methyltransferase 1
MPYRILDLFAGAGGLSLGFEHTQLFNVAAIVENNKNAAKTYINNHPGLKNYDDILKVDFKKLLDECGKIDVVIGGPPCQGFSNANRQRRQLINGSNELVKRYVKAIEEVKPKIFVMENVKTIASDKHSFCVTNGDKEYIENKLRLQLHDKDVVLYEGADVKAVYQLYNANRNCIANITLMTEEQLYILYNICKKKDKLDKYFSKEINVKRVEEIADSMQQLPNMPEWYNKYTINAKQILDILLETQGKEKDIDIDALRSYWNVQRFYQGIQELTEKDAIFSVLTNNQKIVIRMSTYIVIDYLRKAFEDLGYVTNEKILNAATFGVPQTRERFLLIGVNKEFKKICKEDIRLPEPIITNPEEYVTVEEAIQDLQAYEPTTGDMDVDIDIERRQVPDTYFRTMVMNVEQNKIHNHVCTLSRDVAVERFKRIGQGENFHSLPKELKSSYENPARTQNTIYRRLDPKKPSDTVVNVRKSMWIHPNLNRAVSAREAARLQSFPDSYKFYGTKDSVYQQIGNAVPPLLGRAVAETVLDILGNQDDYITLRKLYEEKKQ